MSAKQYNDLRATLGASLTNSATAVTFAAALTHSNGVAVPTITGDDYIPLSILDASGNLSEIVYLTAYIAAATTGTISRGKEGTTGVAQANGRALVSSPLAKPLPYVASSSQTRVVSGSQNVTLPAGIQAGDIICLFVLSSYTPLSVPGFSQSMIGTDGGAYVQTGLFMKAADGTEGGTTVAVSLSNSDTGEIFVAVVRNAAAYTGARYASSFSNTVTTLDAQSAGGKNDLVLIAAAYRDTGLTLGISGTVTILQTASDSTYVGKLAYRTGAWPLQTVTTTSTVSTRTATITAAFS